MNFNDQLNEYYSENGKIFTYLEAAISFLKKKGFYKSRGVFRNCYGKKAFITKVKDYTYNKAGDRSVRQIGWLVTLGGEPISHLDLKLAPISKDLTE